MNVLFVSALLPYPLHSGGQVRIYNLLKQLSGRHEITLFSFIRNPSEQEYVKNMPFLKDVRLVLRGKRYHPRYLVAAAAGKYPLLLTSYENYGMRDLISRHLQGTPCDLIHLEPFYVYPSLPDTALPTIISEHNVEYEVYDAYARRFSPGVLRPILFHEASGIRAWETRILKQATHVISVSEQDAVKLKTMSGGKPVTVVPNGVDTSWFRYSERRFPKGRMNVLFTGNFHWFPNMEALTQIVNVIWPEIRKCHPDARLTIAGTNIPAWAGRTGDAGVTISEKVADIRTSFDDADVLIAPMTIPGGSKFKILEAMAAGVPVITTKAGISGLPVTDAVHFSLYDSVPGLMNALEMLERDAPKRTRLIREARRLVTDIFDWKRIAGLQSDVWEQSV